MHINNIQTIFNNSYTFLYSKHSVRTHYNATILRNLFICGHAGAKMEVALQDSFERTPGTADKARHLILSPSDLEQLENPILNP